MAKPTGPFKPEDIYLREILFEFQTVGGFVRVTAIDPETRTEVITVGDPSADRDTLERIATRKLKYVLARTRNEEAAKSGRLA